MNQTTSSTIIRNFWRRVEDDCGCDEPDLAARRREASRVGLGALAFIALLSTTHPPLLRVRSIIVVVNDRCGSSPGAILAWYGRPCGGHRGQATTLQSFRLTPRHVQGGERRRSGGGDLDVNEDGRGAMARHGAGEGDTDVVGGLLEGAASASTGGPAAPLVGGAETSGGHRIVLRSLWWSTRAVVGDMALLAPVWRFPVARKRSE